LYLQWLPVAELRIEILLDSNFLLRIALEPAIGPGRGSHGLNSAHHVGLLIQERVS